MGTDVQLFRGARARQRPSHGFGPQGLCLAAAALLRRPAAAQPIGSETGACDGRGEGVEWQARSRTPSRIPRVTRGDLAGVQLSGAPAPNAAAKLRHPSDTLCQSALQRGQEATRQENHISFIACFHSPHGWRRCTPPPENLTRPSRIASAVFNLISSTGDELSV